MTSALEQVRHQLMCDFYEHFRCGRSDEMAKMYADDARFVDPFFDLRGAQIGAMWRMLCSGLASMRCPDANKLTVEVDRIEVDGDRGKLRWIATYTHPATCNVVSRNEVNANFLFRGEQITEHRDDFDMERWVEMAFKDRPQRFLRFTPFGRYLLRRGARKRLAASMK